MKGPWSVQFAGLLVFLSSCVFDATCGQAYGHADGCPLGCQTAPPPALDWPLDPPAPMVTLKVRVPVCAVPGKELEYRYFIENNSPADAHHVIVKNPLPANV